jgi:hypothetical protein
MQPEGMRLTKARLARFFVPAAHIVIGGHGIATQAAFGYSRTLS